MHALVHLIATEKGDGVGEEKNDVKVYRRDTELTRTRGGILLVRLFSNLIFTVLSLVNYSNEIIPICLFCMHVKDMYVLRAV